jgi:hypothetical protein
MDFAQLQLGHRFYHLDVPTCYDELTAEQFEAVNYIKCTTTDRRSMIFEILMAVVPISRQHLLGLLQVQLSARQYATAFNLLWLFFFFDRRYFWQFFATDDVIDALPHIDWLFDKQQNKFKSAIAEFKHKGVLYKGPRTLLSGVIWKQMQLADTLVERFTNEKNEQLLNELAAVLYVPDGEVLNTDDNSIPERIELFKGLRIQLKYAIYSNYVLLRDAFYKQFELPKTELALEGRPDWETVTLSVAENGSLGTYQQVENAPARTVLKYFEMKHKEHRK